MKNTLNYLKYSAFFLGTLIIGFLLGGYRYMTYEAIAGFLSIFVLILTFFVIILYTKETHELKNLQKKQIELSIKPILNVFINPGRILYIENLTENFTKNINIEEIKTKDNTYRLSIDPNYISKSHTGKPITILRNEKDKISLGSFLADISTDLPEHEISIVITHEDIENSEHKTTFIIYNLDNITQSKIKMVY